MAPLRTLVLPAFAAVAAAQSIADYVPGCGTPCISETVDASTTCEADDASCICEYAYTVKRNAEVCLRDGCSESDYGLVMTGYDEFCRDVGDGPEPEPTTSSDVPEPTSDTTVPPTTTSTTEAGEPTVYPTQEPPTTSEYETSETTEYPISTPTSTEYPTAPPETTEEPTTYPEQPTTAEEPTTSYGESSISTMVPPIVTTSIIESLTTPVEEPTTTYEEPTYYPTGLPGTNSTLTTSTSYPTGEPTDEPAQPTEEPSIVPVPGAAAKTAGTGMGAVLLIGALAFFGF
ncbi:hypothetical protein DL768_002415 [Monosporascus sp. mg162]|nr:hypothetical protein DL768_002415 [Monosporascus sp. mg162]